MGIGNIHFSIATIPARVKTGGMDQERSLRCAVRAVPVAVVFIWRGRFPHRQISAG